MILQTDKLSKRYHQTWAVWELDLAVEEGQVFGFLGPNGAGKSTTIRMLLGLIKPSSGGFELFSQNVRRSGRSIYKKVGSLVEKPDFYLYLSAEKNLKLLGELSGGVTVDRISEVLEIVGLAERGGDKVSDYSHGMMQRLGIAQALLAEPDLIILDEPTSGLDPAGIKEIRDLIVTLSKDLGITVFLSSHILHEIEQVCTHMAIIDRGRLVVQGDVYELLRETDFYVTEVIVDDPQRARTILEPESWIEKVSLEKDILKVRVSGENRPQLTDFLVRNRFAVSAVIPRTSLEDYYLTLLNRDPDEA